MCGCARRRTASSGTCAGARGGVRLASGPSTSRARALSRRRRRRRGRGRAARARAYGRARASSRARCWPADRATACRSSRCTAVAAGARRSREHLGMTQRSVKRALERIMALGRAELVRLAGHGCGSGERLVSRLAFGLASEREIRAAQLHLATCPRCGALYERLDLWREKVAASLPIPAARASAAAAARARRRTRRPTASRGLTTVDGGGLGAAARAATRARRSAQAARHGDLRPRDRSDAARRGAPRCGRGGRCGLSGGRRWRDLLRASAASIRSAGSAEPSARRRASTRRSRPAEARAHYAQTAAPSATPTPPASTPTPTPTPAPTTVPTPMPTRTAAGSNADADAVAGTAGRVRAAILSSAGSPAQQTSSRQRQPAKAPASGPGEFDGP